MKLGSRERLTRTLKGEDVDRVPISLYEFDGFYDGWIGDYPEYIEILKYAEDKTDKMYFWSPPRENDVLFYGKVGAEDVASRKWREGKSSYRRTAVMTPLGELSTLHREDEGIHSAWNIEPLCKGEEDAERLLSLPYVPWRPPVNSFFDLDEKINDSGIVLCSIPDALCLTAEIFGFARFLTMYIDNQGLIFRLMDFFQQRICGYLEHLLREGAVTLYRIVGPEYATPPYLAPREFDRLVTRYDKELVCLLHAYGAKARLHSHGKIKRVLGSFTEMGIDATDPVEPPPDGDVELKEAREALGSKVTLIGNIEERLFEIGSKDDIENAVKKAIAEGASGGGFILCPTAMPLTTPLDKRIGQNVIHYIDCGLKYGKL